MSELRFGRKASRRTHVARAAKVLGLTVLALAPWLFRVPLSDAAAPGSLPAGFAHIAETGEGIYDAIKAGRCDGRAAFRRACRPYTATGAPAAAR